MSDRIATTDIKGQPITITPLTYQEMPGVARKLAHALVSAEEVKLAVAKLLAGHSDGEELMQACTETCPQLVAEALAAMLRMPIAELQGATAHEFADALVKALEVNRVAELLALSKKARTLLTTEQG